MSAGSRSSAGYHALPVGDGEVAHPAEEQREEGEADSHVGQGLRRGDRDLGPGVEVDPPVALTGDRRSDDVDEADDLAALALDLPHGEGGVGRLTRLAHRDVEGVRLDDGVAVAELRRGLGVRRDAGHLLDHQRAQLADVVRRPASQDLDAAEGAQLAWREVEAVEPGRAEAGVEPTAEHAGDRLGLLRDLLGHEVTVRPDLDVVGRHLDLGRHPARVVAVAREGAVVLGRDDRQIAVVEVHDRRGVPHQGRHVGRDEHLAVAHADDERRAVARHHDAIRLSGVEDCDGIRADDLLERLDHAVLERGGTGACHQVRQHLGVGVGAEGHAVGAEPGAQRARVVDDAVVHDADATVLARVRVGVGLRGRTVRRPPGVPDADGAGEPLGQGALELPHPADPPHDRGPRGAEHGDAGGVVAAILQARQALDQDGRCWLASDVADDSAHG